MANLNPKIWGPHAWAFMHSVTLAYPKEPTRTDKINYRNFFHAIHPVLPCDSCRRHAAQNMQSVPLTDEALASRTSLVRWCIDLHNEVNKMGHKKQLSIEDALDSIGSMYDEDDIKGDKENPKKNKDKDGLSLRFCIGAVVVLVAGTFLLSKINKGNEKISSISSVKSV